MIERLHETVYFYFDYTPHYIFIGQRLHEMILNPPMKIDGLLPLVSNFSLPCSFEGWLNIKTQLQKHHHCG